MKTMQAAVLERSGEAVHMQSVDIIEPRAGEVRVRVRHCGVCHSDFSIVNGTFPQTEPVILGHEAAGVVESVGPQVTRLAVGDHVVLTPAPACGHCYYCQRGDHSLCPDAMGVATSTLPDGETGLYRGGKPVLRGVGVGAWAEYVITQEHGAIKVPDEVPLNVVCVIGCALQTGAGAVLNTARVEEGASVLIMGLGGIGQAAVQGARIAGAARIIVSDPVAERREMAADFGATDLLDPNQDDVLAEVKRLTGDIGADYAFETAGVGALSALGLEAIRIGGLLVCVGAPPMDQGLSIPMLAYFVTTQKRVSGCMLGSCNSSYDIPRLVRLYQNGTLDLDRMITRRRPLSEVNEAMADMAAGRGIRTVLDI